MLAINPSISSASRDISLGLQLSELSEAEGGWAEFFEKGSVLDESNTIRRASAAILLENGKKWLASRCGKAFDHNTGMWVINEAARSTVLGGYSDYFFPIIRASLANSAALDLISVQPTTRRQATIGYMDWIYGSTKGSITSGQKWIDAQNGIAVAGSSPVHSDYTGEYIDAESFDTVGATDPTVAGTLDYHSGAGIRPGSVRVTLQTSTAGDTILADNGQGGFVVVAAGGNTLSAGTINYMTGAVSITMGSNLTQGSLAVAAYTWNSEGGTLPELDIVPRITTIETKRRALATNISAEGMFDFQQEFGLNYNDQVVTGAASMLNYEQAVEVVRMIWNAATAIGSFSVAIPTGISRSQHIETLLYQIEYTSNTMNTNLGGNGYANFAIVDNNAAAQMAVLPETVFRRERNIPQAMAKGLHKFGRLNDQIDVYRFIHLSRESGASAYGNMVLGWNGGQFGESGAVLAPYQQFYTTEVNETENFVQKQGFAMRYALQLINAKAYAKVTFAA